MTFPIVGWARMPKEQTRPEVLADIARAGVNVFMTCHETPVNDSFHVGLEPGDGRLFRFEKA